MGGSEASSNSNNFNVASGAIYNRAASEDRADGESTSISNSRESREGSGASGSHGSGSGSPGGESDDDFRGVVGAQQFEIPQQFEGVGAEGSDATMQARSSADNSNGFDSDGSGSGTSGGSGGSSAAFAEIHNQVRQIGETIARHRQELQEQRGVTLSQIEMIIKRVEAMKKTEKAAEAEKAAAAEAEKAEKAATEAEKAVAAEKAAAEANQQMVAA